MNDGQYVCGSRQPRARLTTAVLLMSLSAAGAPVPDTRSKDDLYLEVNEKCRGGTIDLLGVHGAVPAANQFLSLSDAATQNSLQVYAACLSSFPGRSNSCDLVGGLGGGTSVCRDLATYADFVAAVFNKGDALAACEKVHINLGKNRRSKRKAIAKKCKFVIDALKSGEGGRICEKARTQGLLAESLFADCKKNLIYFAGLPARCESETDKSKWPLCREKANILFALQSKDPQACLRTPWCRALANRNAEFCEPYLLQANKSFCERIAQTAAPIRTVRIIKERKLQEDAAKQRAPKYKKGAPMQWVSPDVKRQMERIEGKK